MCATKVTLPSNLSCDNALSLSTGKENNLTNSNFKCYFLKKNWSYKLYLFLNLLEWCNVIDKADHFAEIARNKITGVVVGGGAGSLCHSRQSSPSFVLHLPTIPLNWSVISSSTFRFTRDPPSHQQTQVNYRVYS